MGATGKEKMEEAGKERRRGEKEGRGARGDNWGRMGGTRKGKV